MVLPNVAKRFADAVFVEDDGISEERKEMFLTLYSMGLSQELARDIILGSILMKRKLSKLLDKSFALVVQ